MAMAEFYKEQCLELEDPAATNHFEVTKELCVRILRHCGVWSSTKPFADLATAVISAKVLNDKPTCDLNTITYASLAPSQQTRTFAELVSLSSDAVRARLSLEVTMATTVITGWIWEVEERHDLPLVMDLFTDVTLALQDLLAVLKSYEQ